MTKLKLRYLLLALVPLAVAGCVTAEEVDQDTCASFGFKPGTDAFANCMMEQSARADEKRREWEREDRAREERKRERKKEKERRRREESGKSNNDWITVNSAENQRRRQNFSHKKTVLKIRLVSAYFTRNILKNG